MRRKEADGTVEKLPNPEKTALVLGVARREGQSPVEITDADYRSIFLPCEALEEKKERPG